MRLSRILLLFSVAVLVSCSTMLPHVPNYRDDNARVMLDEATLVLLGKVRRVDSPGPVNPGWFPVLVTLDVNRVLKGQYASTSACFVHFLPGGGFSLPRLDKPREGQAGVFALIPGGRCYYVVRESWPIIPSYRMPSDPSLPIEAFVAEATFPVYGCGGWYHRDIDRDVIKITQSLIGVRRTVKMLEDASTSSNPLVRPCACRVLTKHWKRGESCLTTLPPGSFDQTEIDQIKNDIQDWRDKEMKQFNADPIEWMEEQLFGNGVDLTLLFLSQLTFHPDWKVSPGTCQRFGESLEAPEFRRMQALERELFPESVHSIALDQFRTWLSLDCPANYEPFRYPTPSQL